MESHRIFGVFLRKTRLHKGVTLQQLAKHLGCSVPYLSDVEHGNRGPLTEERIKQVAKLFVTDLEDLQIKAAISRGKFNLPVRVSARHDEVASHLATSWQDLDESAVEAIDRILKRSRKAS